MTEATNIYPIYDKMMTRADKEKLLGQRGVHDLVYRTFRIRKKYGSFGRGA